MFSEMTISTMKRIANAGNPTANGLLESLSQLREKLKRVERSSNKSLSSKPSSPVYSHTLQKIWEEYVPGDFEFNFGGSEMN